MFDVVLRRMDDVEKIPSLPFAGLLFLITVLAGLRLGSKPRGSKPSAAWAAALWLFSLGDWALLRQLPRAGKSFGPAKPTALILAALRAAFGLLPVRLSLPLQMIGSLLVIKGFWDEPHQITVTRQQLRSKKLKPGRPVRVLHLGDLHIERITQRERQLNRLIKELAPDVILFSGDVLNLSFVEDPEAIQAARAVMGEWRAPGGVYAVTGSPAVDLAHVFPKLIEGLGITWLRDERKTVQINGQSIDIIGLTCTHKPFEDGPKLEALMGTALANYPKDNSPFTILLYHTPDLAPNAANTRAVDLQLSGHTHGGQVRLPFIGALYAASLYGKRFEAGRYTLGDMTLYVTRGIGLEGKAAPRVRFLCPPEIILWEIDG